MVFDGLVVVVGRLSEDRWVRQEGYACAMLILSAGSDFLEVLFDVAAILEGNLVDAAVFPNNDFAPRGKSVDDRGADAVQAAGNLVSSAFAEFAAGVKDRISGLYAR